MKLNYQQLPLHLKNQLLPIYLLSGDEFLLLQESKDLIRKHAKKQGFSDIERFETNKEFDWNKLIESTQALSLFSEKTYIEIKLTQKPATGAAKVLTQFLENLHPSYMVVIISDKLDAGTQKTSWFDIIVKKGAHIAIWPLDLSSRRSWVEKRLKEHHLHCDPAAIQFLVDQTEGNLLAAAQEIEKLALLFNRAISLNDVKSVMGDSASFDVFNFTDALLQGNATKILRILRRLREQAVEPILILWALMREIRLLLTVKLELKNKVEWALICRKNQIWDKKKPFVQKAIGRLTEETLSHQLLLGGKVDRMIKGLELGNPWNELEAIALHLCFKNFLFSAGIADYLPIFN